MEELKPVVTDFYELFGYRFEATLNAPFGLPRLDNSPIEYFTNK